MTSKETILVTGGGGFIGGWIVEVLHLSGSNNVRAGIRNWSSAARLARFPVEIVLCDVMDKECISQAMSGVSCVIHCVSGSTEAIIQGTKNMLDAALQQGVRRFVHLSTAEVYGNVKGDVNEAFLLQPTGNPYGDAKIEAEKLCWKYCKMGLPVTVIRPSIVYGPFSRDWTVRFAQRLQSGNWGIFKGYGEGFCNLIYVTDLVSGILLSAHKECAVGKAFNLVGPDLITWNQYFERLNAALNFPGLKVIDSSQARLKSAAMDPIRSLGKFVLKHFSTPLRKLSQGNRQARELLQYADKSLKTFPSLDELSLYNREAVYLTNQARDLLGYQPAIGIDQGLDLSVQWMRDTWIV